MPRRDQWVPNPSRHALADRERARDLIVEVGELATKLACGELPLAPTSFAARTPAHVIRQLVSGAARRVATPDIVERWRWAREVVGTNASANTQPFNYGLLIEFDELLTPEERLALGDYFDRADEFDKAADMVLDLFRAAAEVS